jgi:membrane protein required for colicin V production
MDANPATAMDAIALGVLLLSSVLALSRGFVRESLSIASFIVASLAAIFTLPMFLTVAMNWIESELIATVVTAFLIFVGVYILMTMLTHKVSGLVKYNSHIGVLDRTAGFAFGVVRGMVMLAIVLLGWNFFARADQTPDWVSKARMYPAVLATADALKSLVPNSRVAQIDVPEPARTQSQPQKPVARPKPKPVQAQPEQGYEQNDRNILNQVITTKLEGEQASEDDPNATTPYSDPNPQD